VLLALVFTTFFIVGLYQWGVSRSLDREPENVTFTWTWFWVMAVGTTLTAIAIIGGLIPGSEMSAAVLYTFYPPLQAHPLFYIGAAGLIVGSWGAGADWFWSFWNWREDHPDESIPLQTYMVLFTMLMWYVCSIGVALEVVVLLIPWSLGLVTNIELIRCCRAPFSGTSATRWCTSGCCRPTSCGTRSCRSCRAGGSSATR
jgi:cytochrome c oxidase subunit 1